MESDTTMESDTVAEYLCSTTSDPIAATTTTTAESDTTTTESNTATGSDTTESNTATGSDTTTESDTAAEYQCSTTSDPITAVADFMEGL